MPKWEYIGEMMNISDEQILKGILKNDSLVLQFIYKEFFNAVGAFIKRNQGNDHDANDIFQEAIIVIYRKLKHGHLDLRGLKFSAYLFSICRFLWLKALEQKKEEREMLNETLPHETEVYDESLFETVEKNARMGLFQKHFMELAPDCQKILKLFFEKVSLKLIAQVMGFKSEVYAKKRKYKCKELLIERIKLDPEYIKVLKNDERNEF